MTSAERKRRFDQKMRNADGADPSQPARMPCVIYLSEEARAVLAGERRLAKAASLAPAADSMLVEALLIAHGWGPITEERALQSIDKLVRVFEASQNKISALEKRLAQEQNRPGKPPTAKAIVEAVARRHNGAHNELLELASDLRALHKFEKNEAALASKLRGRLDDHMRKLFGIK